MEKIVSTIVTFLLVFFSIFSLTGCFNDSDEDIAKKNIEKLINVIQKKDHEAVKALFAPSKIASLENFDKSIDDLFNYYQGNNVILRGDIGPITDNDNHNGQITKLHTIVIDISTSVKEYRFAIKWLVEDTGDVGNVGIWKLFVCEKTGELNQEFAYWGEENTYGLFVGSRTAS